MTSAVSCQSLSEHVKCISRKLDSVFTTFSASLPDPLPLAGLLGCFEPSAGKLGLRDTDWPPLPPPAMEHMQHGEPLSHSFLVAQHSRLALLCIC